MKIKVCFYKGFKGDLLDKLICLVTFSKYSHCELILNNGYSYSSSSRDNGVRRKLISYSSDKWDTYYINVPDESNVYYFFTNTKGFKYDYVSLLINHILPFFKIKNPKQYYCSEWITEALNMIIPNPPFKHFQLSPGQLFRILKKNNLLDGI